MKTTLFAASVVACSLILSACGQSPAASAPPAKPAGSAAAGTPADWETVVAAGKREELGSAEQALKAAHGLPHQQRLFLPVLAQKYRDAQSAEKPVDRDAGHCSIIAAGDI